MDIKIKTRVELPALLSSLKLNGTGVEIGVQRGLFSKTLLKGSTLSRLYSIDPWRVFNKEEYIDLANVSQRQHNMKYLETFFRLIFYFIIGRSRIIRKTSFEAKDDFVDGSLDFIFIDALHTYEGCKDDMLAWWPKLKKGGMFAGHDYLDGNIEPDGIFGVKSAVDEFVKERKISPLYVTVEKWPTWYFIKE